MRSCEDVVVVVGGRAHASIYQDPPFALPKKAIGTHRHPASPHTIFECN